MTNIAPFIELSEEVRAPISKSTIETKELPKDTKTLLSDSSVSELIEQDEVLSQLLEQQKRREALAEQERLENEKWEMVLPN
jgi:hypothetical protein